MCIRDRQMAASAAPGLPGSVRTEDAAPGVLLQARAAEGMILSLIHI